MCQPKSKGGRRCSAHQPGYLGLKVLVKEDLGLDEAQIKYSYDVLRFQGSSHSKPSLDEYKEFIGEYKGILSEKELTDSVKNRVKRQLDKKLNEEQLPDGPTFFALKRLVENSRKQKERIDHEITKFSRSRGIPEEEARGQYEALLSELVSPKKQRRQGILDAKTKTAFKKLYQDHKVIKEDHRRVEHSPLSYSSYIETAGYDPEDGRLEVQIDGKIYAFRDVDEHTWGYFQEHPSVYFQKLRQDVSKHYFTHQESEKDAYRVWCDKCREFKLASGHKCRETGSIENVYAALKRKVAKRGDSTALKRPEWFVPWEKKETVELGENPDAEELREEIADGEKVYSFTLNFLSEEDGNEVSAEFLAGRASPGEITLSMESSPRCTCEVFQRNRICEHVSNGKFERSARRYYSMVDDIGAQNNYDMLFPYHAYSPETGSLKFKCGDEGIDKQTLEEIAYICKEDYKAMLYVENKEVAGEGNALGAYVFSRKGAEIDFVAQARCTRCNRIDCEHITGLGERYAKQIQKRMLTPGYRLSQLRGMDERGEGVRVSTDLEVEGERETKAYTTDLASYISDMHEAERRIKKGENPLEFSAVTGLTGGNISSVPGEGRGFGVEIEYSLEGATEEEAKQIREEIARALYEEGLSDQDQDFEYGKSYEVNQYKQWAVESDSSVSGELISPVLYDTEESWSQIAKVCDIIRQHGGTVDQSCGQHVHMGLTDEARYSSQSRINIMNFMKTHQDSLRRAGTNPQRKIHRGDTYSSPFSRDEDVQSVVYEMRELPGWQSNRDRIVNFQHDDRVEFRDADGSLDPAHIQAQVMITAAIVNTVERGREPQEDIATQEIGQNRKRTQLLTGGRASKLSDEELIVSDLAYMRTIDALFDDEASRKKMVSLAAMIPWQKGQ